ncbi:MAG: hypothetical protein Q7T86_10735 [Hyphomicrobiaceae bacterium]|jgi:hypothetical protein|nr:hypothetical protein [Hyphomicrobiaceae bacterium]
MTTRWGLGLLVIGLLAAGFWVLRGPASADDKQIAAYAGQCPRWVRLAEELLTFEGSIPERCEHISGGSVFSSGHVYKATPNIEVLVSASTDPATPVPHSVVIRDTNSKASVTYNAEALALVK